MFADELNRLGKETTPLFFIIDYKRERYEIIPLSNLPKDIKFHKKDSQSQKSTNKVNLNKFPITFEKYRDKFEKIVEEIRAGNTYMLNFTQPTRIEIDLSLLDIYSSSNELFNLYYRDEFVCFTPEKFVEILDDKIYTYPMKGTISCSIKNAKDILMDSKKELSEHVMVVDLLRNDLGIVAKDINVEEFRKIEKINTKGLYQSSSKISAKLEKDWRERIGDIIYSMLPAGSISGTPKRSSCDIIEKIEEYNRGFFSGVCGLFDGDKLESYVLIRFIEKNENELFYKSGGGITIDSQVAQEYQEMIEKIYVPAI